MDYEFLTQFHPHIIDVVNKDRTYWKNNNYSLLLDKAGPNIHTFGYVYQGNGLFEINDVSTPVNPGSMFHISPGNRVYIKTSSESCLYFYSIHFYYSLIKWEGSANKGILSTSGLPFPNIFHLLENPKLFELFSKLFESWTKKEIDYEWQAKISMFSIMNLTNLLLQKENEQINDQAQLIFTAIEYMQNHYHIPVNRDVLAAYVSLSPSYFSTLFKNQTGYTPMQYLTKLRIDKAKQLLLSTHLPIEKIGMQVGFTDSFYFSRVFTKETGLSPRAFKNS